MNEDYFLDDDEDIGEGDFGDFGLDEDDLDEESEVSTVVDIDEDVDIGTVDKSGYRDVFTQKEIWLTSAYNDLQTAAKSKDESSIYNVSAIVLMANPRHTSASTRSHVLAEMFHKQGHNRLANTKYLPTSAMSGEDIDIDYVKSEDFEYNRLFRESAREQIAEFVKYLTSRDLSKDSVVNKRRKQRHLPALIILLFSSSNYELIIDCPTMPKEYDDQINRALQTIMKSKFEIVEMMARKYEEVGRPNVAEAVRKAQLTWFEKERAEMRTYRKYDDLNLTEKDLLLYQEYRTKFNNTSKTITQEVISDLIEVVIDAKAGIYEKLKEKTRSENISDVKQIFIEWSKSISKEEEILAKKVVYKNKLGLED